MTSTTVISTCLKLYNNLLSILKVLSFVFNFLTNPLTRKLQGLEMPDKIWKLIIPLSNMRLTVNEFLM